MPYKNREDRLAASRRFREKNPGYGKAYVEARVAENPNYHREVNAKYAGRYDTSYPHSPGYWRLRRYGVTEEQYAQMVEEQGGKCAICQQDKPLHVDHCHGTKRVRGLLCHSCNTALGHLKDDPELLDKAAAYLRK